MIVIRAALAVLVVLVLLGLLGAPGAAAAQPAPFRASWISPTRAADGNVTG